MLFVALLTAALVSATSLTITEPVDGETYNGDWLTVRAIVENNSELPDSVRLKSADSEYHELLKGVS